MAPLSKTQVSQSRHAEPVGEFGHAAQKRSARAAPNAATSFAPIIPVAVRMFVRFRHNEAALERKPSYANQIQAANSLLMRNMVPTPVFRSLAICRTPAISRRRSLNSTPCGRALRHAQSALPQNDHRASVKSGIAHYIRSSGRTRSAEVCCHTEQIFLICSGASPSWLTGFCVEKSLPIYRLKQPTKLDLLVNLKTAEELGERCRITYSCWQTR